MTALYVYVLVMLTLMSSSLTEKVDDWYTAWSEEEAALASEGGVAPPLTCAGVALLGVALVGHVVNLGADCCSGRK